MVQPKCLSVRRTHNKLWDICTLRHGSAKILKEEPRKHTAVWRNLQIKRL